MKHSMYKFIIRLFIPILSVMLVIPTAHAENYCSIAEISESTPQRWTETYETKWRTISIDVPIHIPDVAEFPIVKVRLMPAVAEDQLTDYEGTIRNIDGSLTADRKKDDHLEPNSRPMNAYTYWNGEAPEHQPENVSLTYEDALSLCREEINRLWGLLPADFALDKVTVEDRVYRYRREGDDIVWGEPVNDEGRYKMTFRQLIHGIDVESGKECYDRLNISSEAALHNVSCYMAFSNSQNMKIRAALYDELETVYKDVPLLPFAQAKEAIEAEIYAGHLRSVDVMKLCYIPYLDTQDRDVLWLLPAWYVKGAYTRNVKAELLSEMDENGQVVYEGMERREVIFQAQAGTLLEYTDASNNRRIVPEVFSWERIQ